MDKKHKEYLIIREMNIITHIMHQVVDFLDVDQLLEIANIHEEARDEDSTSKFRKVEMMRIIAIIEALMRYRKKL